MNESSRVQIPDTKNVGHKGQSFFGWWMVAIGATSNFIASVHSSAATVFFLPVTQELGLSRAALGLVFSLSRMEGGIEGPIAGWVIDRFGPRIPTLITASIGGVGFLLLATVHSYLGFLVIYLGLMSVGFNVVSGHTMHAVANLWFIRYRTRVMSIFSSVVRLGHAIFTPLVAIIVLNYGWRTGSILSGILVLGVILPVTYFMRRSPESEGQLPDGDQPSTVKLNPTESTTSDSQAGGLTKDFTAKAALRTPAIWIISANLAARSCIMSALHVHFIPIFVWMGLSQQMGANLTGLIGLIAIPLILIMGWLGDRLSKRMILLVTQMAYLPAMLVVVYSHSFWAIALFVVLMAVGESMAPVIRSIVGEYYGRKAFATLNGIMTSISTISAVTPVFAGWVYDQTESYSIAFIVFGAIAALASFALLFLRNPSYIPVGVAGLSDRAAGGKE